MKAVTAGSPQSGRPIVATVFQVKLLEQAEPVKRATEIHSRRARD